MERMELMACTLGLLSLMGVAKGATNQSNTASQLHWQQQQQQLKFSIDFQSIVDDLHEPHLTRTSVIFGLTKVVNGSQVNAQCEAHLRQVQRGILSKQPWAMKGE